MRDGRRAPGLAPDDLAPVGGKPLGELRGEQPGALLHACPAAALEYLEGGQRAGDGLGAERESVEAPRVLVQAGVEARSGVGEVGVAPARDGEPLAQGGRDVEQAGPVGAAQPLLARPGVGSAAQRAHVGGDGADALGAVEQHGDPGVGERRGGGEAPGLPAHVRDGDEPSAGADGGG